jgi:putative oxidoreductase
MGLVLQRLFSTFPDSWPGTGLLLLRVAVAIPLLHGAAIGVMGGTQPGLLAPNLIAGGAGILLLAGMYTPITGTLVAIAELWMIFSHPARDARASILLAVLGVALAMLGPGAWSVDARLFGRKRIDFRDR